MPISHNAISVCITKVRLWLKKLIAFWPELKGDDETLEAGLVPNSLSARARRSGAVWLQRRGSNVFLTSPLFDSKSDYILIRGDEMTKLRSDVERLIKTLKRGSHILVMLKIPFRHGKLLLAI
jgi:hypothetical protein